MTEFSWFDALPPAAPGRPPERLSRAGWNAREDAREAAARAADDERAAAVREAAKNVPAMVPPVRRPLDETCGVCGLRSECGWAGSVVDRVVCPNAETP
jgi:hypothetical protein